MTQPAATETAIAFSDAAGLPDSTQTCPMCGTRGPCQQLVDHPTYSDAPTPYGCPACGAEFSSAAR